MPGLHKKPKGYVSDAQRKAVHASKKDGGKGNPNKKPKLRLKRKLEKTSKGFKKTSRRVGTDIQSVGNLVQQAVAKRRVKKFGQQGSAIVPDRTVKKGGTGDKFMKLATGEKTLTHSTAKDSRRYARATRGLARYDARQTKKEARGVKQAVRYADRQIRKENKAMANKPMAKFPDLSGDGKVTKKDILIGRGVIDKPKMLRKKRKNYA